MNTLHTSSNTGVLRFGIRLAYQQEGGFMQLNVDCIYYRDEFSPTPYHALLGDDLFIRDDLLRLKKTNYPSQTAYWSQTELVTSIYINWAINVNSAIEMDAHLSKGLYCMAGLKQRLAICAANGKALSQKPGVMVDYLFSIAKLYACLCRVSFSIKQVRQTRRAHV